jgi:predicted PurR-regulated permease PerM
MHDPDTALPSYGSSYLYMFASFVVIALGLRMAQAILQPLLLAVFISVISVPVYAWLVQRKVASWLSLLIVISAVVGLLLIILVIVMTSLADFTARQDHYMEQLRVRTLPIRTKLDEWFPEPAPFPDMLDDQNSSGDASSQTSMADSAAADDPGTDGIPAPAPAPAENPPDRDAESTVDLVDAQSANEAGEAATVNSPELQDAAPGVASETALATERLLTGRDAIPVLLPDDEIVPEMAEQQRVLFVPAPAPPRTRKSWRELILGQFDPSMILRLVVSLAGSISQMLSSGILILLTVVFILLEASSFPAKFARAFASEAEKVSDANRARFQAVIDSVRSYIALKTALSVVTGFLIAAWLWLFGVPYAGLWGLLAFLLNYIPNVGSIIAALPALLIAWLDLGWLPAFACAVGFLAVNLAIGNIVEPRVMGRGMGLSPLVVFCCMVFWGWVLGPVGMLVSVPLTMAVRVALEAFDDTRWLGTLLGN